MYAVGNLPDHVTRYNHKNTSRWLVQVRPPRQLTMWAVLDKLVIALGFAGIAAGLIVTALAILQGASV